MDLYDVLKYIHILAAVVWVGGAFTSQVFAIRAQQSSDPVDLIRLGRWLEFLGLRVFAPASLILIAAGVLMTIQRWSFGQLWISISIALWLVSFLAGIFYLGPKSKTAAELFEAEGPSSPAGVALRSRLFLVSRIELVFFVVIVALMVFKPGA
jgi:uncharacterized membrane protein